MQGLRRLQLAICLLLCSWQGQTAELLGKISDETASVPEQEKPAPANQPKIIYRVICSADGESSDDCDQPPIDDSLEFGQAPPIKLQTPVAPDPAPTTPIQDKTATQTAMEKTPGRTAKPAVGKKVKTRQQPKKKSAKKSARNAKN